MPTRLVFSVAVARLAALLSLAAPCAGAAQIDIHGPAGSVAFGSTVKLLPNGNVVVVDSGGPVAAIGAVYLYDPAGSLISALTGASANDQVGSGGVVVLGNGSFVVLSPQWNNGAAAAAGAATWVDGTSGLNGVVTAGNSLVGAATNDHVGFAAFSLTGNTNYVVISPNWNGDRGAATWCSGAGSTSALVSGINSLIGTNAGDKVGSRFVFALNNGNYLVKSPEWNGTLGAVTWGSGTTGVKGLVSATNSLVGSSAGDAVGSLSGSSLALLNGNYVLATPSWNGNTGAVTWGSGTAGVSGVISSGNSIVGSSANDRIGFNLLLLSNDNYVTSSQSWNGNRGAATWGNGSVGSVGVVSAANSLVGTSANDYVGKNLSKLSNGHYVVRSYLWNGSVGAATWSNGANGGTIGSVFAGNSLVGSTANDQIGLNFTALSNGNYVVGSTAWNNSTGAAAWGSATSGVAGVVSAANAMLGAVPNDRVGLAYALASGHYVLCSVHWNADTGAATWVNGAAATAGLVTNANSLTGSVSGDGVCGGGVSALGSGNYVVSSPQWSSSTGAVTWLNGSAPTVAAVTAANSLTGAAPGDLAGSVTVLDNDDYLVRAPGWSSNRGAVTWRRGGADAAGVISALNSLVGAAVGDAPGSGGVVALPNSLGLIISPAFGGGVGAITLARSGFPLVGAVQPWNSVIAAAPGGGTSLRYAYDAPRERLVVGRPAEQLVSLFTVEQLFAYNFEK